MKLKNKKYKLLKLQLLKLKCYKVENRYIEKFEKHFKKTLLIIFKFNKNNKKILFIGFPFVFVKKFRNIFTKTKHSLIIESLGIKSLLINKKNRKIKINKIPDLIVILTQHLNISIVNKNFKLKIPIIKLDNIIQNSPLKPQIVFLLFLYSIFKKSVF